MFHRTLPWLSAAALLLSAACGSTETAGPAAPTAGATQEKTTRAVFEDVAPSVVAILNDDEEDRKKESLELERALGRDLKTPNKVIDVSRRKEAMPHGTGFAIEGGLIVTAAHVIYRPDRLKITTRLQQTVEAEVVRMDEVRDVAILRPKEPLRDVPPLPLEPGDLKIGDKVWALGHTGQGLWQLAWGISEGIASGVVDVLGVKLLFFDAAVYPGFSGGPVVMRGADGVLRVVGVNHAIFNAGGLRMIANISSASSILELREVVAGKPHAMEATLKGYLKAKKAEVSAELFITTGLSVHRDAAGQQLAEIRGHQSLIELHDSKAFIPVAAVLFHAPSGNNEIDFELRDPFGQVVAKAQKTVRVGKKQRVSFVSAGFAIEAKVPGPYEVIARLGDKKLGASLVDLDLPGDDEELFDELDPHVTEDGEPEVDIVVAAFGRDEPLHLSGIRSSWAERSYPRRVEFTWFARGTRGWSGTNVAISAYVLDPDGQVVGRSVGCFRPEIRPEHPWTCLGHGGAPLAMKEGPYDIVFVLNDRPVASWPMEAALRTDEPAGNHLERWMREMQRKGIKRSRPRSRAPQPSPAPAAEAKKAL